MAFTAAKLLNVALSPVGLHLSRAARAATPPPEPVSADTFRHRLWELDADFQRARAAMRSVTLVAEIDTFTMYQLARHTRTVAGDIAEIGVYKGGTARVLATVSAGWGKSLHLFDTFAGMPETHPEKDWHKSGDFNDTSLEGVRRVLDGFDDVRFHPGLFPTTADPVRDRRFSFVHVDVDIYQSVADCCAFFYPRLNPGGVMLFDDYGKVTCPGAREAVDAFFSDKEEVPVYQNSGQCVVHKL